MPRLIVPRSTRTMYGTVRPCVVVVLATSAALVVTGSYGCKQELAGVVGAGEGWGVGGGRRLPPAVAFAGDEVVAPLDQAGSQSAQRARRFIGGERAGDVMAVERQPHLVQRHALRHAHLDQGVAPADEVRAVRQRHDLEIGRSPVLSRLRRDQK